MKHFFQILTLALAIGALIQVVSSNVSAESAGDRSRPSAHEPGV